MMLPSLSSMIVSGISLHLWFILDAYLFLPCLWCKAQRFMWFFGVLHYILYPRVRFMALPYSMMGLLLSLAHTLFQWFSAPVCYLNDKGNCTATTILGVPLSLCSALGFILIILYFTKK